MPDAGAHSVHRGGGEGQSVSRNAAETAAAGSVVAAVNAADKSAVVATGKAEDVVAAACPIVNGVHGFPVSPPANPAAAPTVATTNPASRCEHRCW